MSQRHETHRVPATITLSEGRSIEGEIHLQPLTLMHEGRETPVDLLNRPERFLAVSLTSGDTVLVCKAQIAVVTTDAGMREVDPERLAISKTFVLDVQVVGGQRLSGAAYWELPPTHPRPQDFLNESDSFFEITEGNDARLNGDGTCNTGDDLNWGHPESPGHACENYFPVIFVNGDANIQGGGLDQGILLVAGDLDLRGNFSFYGVIIVQGTFETQGNGNRVYGGVMAGNATLGGQTLTGGSEVQYSNCAVQRAIFNSSLTRARPLRNRSWVDVSYLVY